MRIIVIEDAGWLYINGELSGHLDFGSRPSGPGSVSAFAGLFQGSSIPGRSTAFADFSVWSLD